MTAEKDQEQIVPIILWGALLSSHIIFIFITVTSLYKEDPEFNLTYLLIFAALGLTSLVVSLFFKIRSYRADSMKSFLPMFIISMAMAESIHIFGLVGITAGFLQLQSYYGFMAAGILQHLNCFPRFKNS